MNTEHEVKPKHETFDARASLSMPIHFAHDNHSITLICCTEDDATATLANYELVTPRESQIPEPFVESQKSCTPLAIPPQHLALTFWLPLLRWEATAYPASRGECAKGTVQESQCALEPRIRPYSKASSSV